MEEFSKRTWAQIDLDALAYNFKSIKSKLKKNTKILCVLKADAYGHGAGFLVKEYERLGADWYGVSNLDEAIELRKNGAKKPILIFGYTPSNMAHLLYKYDISQALFSTQYARELHLECKNKNLKLKVHLKIDTGMSRIGFFAQTKEFIEKSAEEIIKIKETMPELEIEGMFTHFSVSSDMTNNREYTIKQYDNFKSMTEKLEGAGIQIPLKHCCNSGAIINFPEMQMDMVRAGITLYGLHPSKETKNKIDLKPVMQLKTVISQVKTIPRDVSIGYGRTFVSKEEMKIASVAIGYADGHFLRLSNKAQVIVGGKRVQIVGRVCMDQLMLDVSGIQNVSQGDIVTVFGTDENECLTVDEWADLTGITNYEIICLIGRRVPRIYVNNGDVVGRVSYI